MKARFTKRLASLGRVLQPQSLRSIAVGCLLIAFVMVVIIESSSTAAAVAAAAAAGARALQCSGHFR
jgi:hypothetical protein